MPIPIRIFDTTEWYPIYVTVGPSGEGSAETAQFRGTLREVCIKGPVNGIFDITIFDDDDFRRYHSEGEKTFEFTLRDDIFIKNHLQVELKNATPGEYLVQLIISSLLN